LASPTETQTAPPDRVHDAFRKTNTRLRKLARSLKDSETDNEELKKELKKARKQVKENRDILGRKADADDDGGDA
jgi:septal ring factor EnvC (AmiA/AmiB activator)